jgi:hypothetical protein
MAAMSFFYHLDPKICENRLKIKNIGVDFIQIGAANSHRCKVCKPTADFGAFQKFLIAG